MYYGSGTVARTASQWRHRRRARGFSQNDVMAAILKIWRCFRNPTRQSMRIPFRIPSLLNNVWMKRV